MTSQAGDYVEYEGEQYELLGDSSKELPMLAQFGIKSAGFSTSC
jgi:hypothetical protein